MNINDLDLSFRKKYISLYSGEVLFSGDIVSVMNRSKLENDNWIFKINMNSNTYILNVKIIEYFNVGNDGIFPFFHEPQGHGLNLLNLNSFNLGIFSKESDKYLHKITLQDLEKIKLYLQNAQKNEIYSIIGKKHINLIKKKRGYYVINFKDTIYYKNILKILRGIHHRNKWISKYHEFPYIYAIANSNKNKNLYEYDSNKDCVRLLLNDFYKIAMLKNNKRNFEIFCKSRPTSKHQEYFFKFKKERTKCEEYCLQVEQDQDCIR